MELRQLKYFLKAKELLNFTSAAEELYISQSTLSQQIKQLEIELGVPLFDRIGKRIVLTQAGEEFSVYAKKSLDKSKEGFLAMQDLRELKSGKLEIGVSYGLRLTLLAALKSFTSKFPSIQIQITFNTTQTLIHLLEESKLDFILTFKDDFYYTNLEYTPLFSSKMSFVTTKENDLNRKEIKLEEVVNYPLIMPSMEYSTTHFIIDALREKNIKPNFSIEINDIPTLIEMVKTGQWYTILAQTTISSDTDLKSIPIKGKNMEREAVIISQKEAYKTMAMQKFLEILKQV
ncbi:LysR substrate-binding domain-containing protein [Chishuiella changwenlii]|uniref:LysR substrate-binding domain-containing protein n=1 Tax=Chishuiella changwenlii TaxID=1434701 RepID=UPI002FD88BBD